MIQVEVSRNLIGLEDLLVGTGTVSQTRGGSSVEMTMINGANFPYDSENTMAEKFDALQVIVDSLPDVVDEDGHMLAGYLLTSASDLNLTDPVDRLWIKEIDGDTNELYFGDTLVLKYDPTDGNLIIPDSSDYIAADAVVTSNFEAADDALEALITALDTATENVQDLDVGTSANNLVQLDGSGKLPAVDGSQLTDLPTSGNVPIGTIVHVPYSTPDTNWLECDGSAISRTTYSALFNKIGTTFGNGDGSTTFNLPDIRGEFIRGWDNGRGKDTGRSFGSTQGDQFKSHNHSFSGNTGSGGSHDHDFSVGTLSGDGNVNQAFARVGELGGLEYTYEDSTDSAGNHNHSFSGSTSSVGSSETRPKNIALMAQIRVL